MALLAALVVYAAAVLVPGQAAAAPRWPAAGVGPDQVRAGVQEWSARCAGSEEAWPANCPQRASDPGSVEPTPFRWRAGRPLVLDVRVRWLDGVGAYEVRGRVNIDVAHDRVLPGGRVEPCTGNFLAPFVALARSAGDGRDFGAYEWSGSTRAGGVVIRYVGPWWEWRGCDNP